MIIATSTDNTPYTKAKDYKNHIIINKAGINYKQDTQRKNITIHI